MSSNDSGTFSEQKVIRLAIRKFLFVWPLHVRHHPSCDNRGNSCNCVVTPVAPAINARDVTDYRLLDEYSTEYIHLSMCQVVLGEECQFNSHNEDVRATLNHQAFPMRSVFDRYADGNANEDYGYFSPYVQLQDMKVAAKNLLLGNSAITPNAQRNAVEVNQHIDKIQSAIFLLSFVLDTLFKEYNHLKTESDCISMGEFFSRALSSNRNIPNCIRNTLPMLRAIYLFQRLFPYRCVFIKGNHRHCRFLLKELILIRQDHRDVILDGYKDGYGMPHLSNDATWCCNVESILYHVHLVNIKGRGKILMKDIIKYCLRLDGQLRKADPIEPIHKFLQLLHECSTDISTTRCISSGGIGFRDVSNSLTAFLTCGKSHIKNKSRGAQDNPVLIWVENKELLRKALVKVFYPNTEDNVIVEYSKGTTYYERYRTRRDFKTVFPDGKTGDNFHVMTFLLLDFLSNPFELPSILKLFKDGYKNDHFRSCNLHELKHSEIWNSVEVIDGMNQFTHMLIRIFGDFGSWAKMQNPPEAVKNVLEAKDDVKKMYQFKVRRCCQQYALFCSMAIAKYIGLYPYTEGIAWSVSNIQSKSVRYANHNIFHWLIYMLKLKGVFVEDRKDTNSTTDNGGSSDEASLPGQYQDINSVDVLQMSRVHEHEKKLPVTRFYGSVLMRFAEVFSTNVVSDAGGIGLHQIFPWTYEEFVRFNYDRELKDFYHLMCTEYIVESRLFFRGLIPRIDVPRRKKKASSKRKRDTEHEATDKNSTDHSTIGGNDYDNSNASRDGDSDCDSRDGEFSGYNSAKSDIGSKDRESERCDSVRDAEMQHPPRVCTGAASSSPVDTLIVTQRTSLNDTSSNGRGGKLKSIATMLETYIGSLAQYDTGNNGKIPQYVKDALRELKEH